MAKVLIRVAKSGDPVRPLSTNAAVSSGRNAIDTDLDLRDRLAELAVRGNSLNADDRAAIFGTLTSTLGKERAEKLMTHAFIFNNRPDVQRLSPEDKLKSFYTIGSSDPDIQGVIGKVKTLGYGVVPGYRESASGINQAIQTGTYGGSVGVVDPEVQRRIRVRTSR